MRPLSAIVVHKDSALIEKLSNSLRQHFRLVNTASSTDAARGLVVDHHAQLLILDLETASVEQLKLLRAEFPAITIVCTHRLPDEQLWIEALSAGAVDCCHESDIRGIVLAACGNLTERPGRTAAA